VIRLAETLIILLALTVPLPAQSERARQAMDDGHYAEAVELYRGLVKSEPRNTGLIVNLGMALDAAGRTREAVEQFQVALKLDAKLVPALVMLGEAYRNSGEASRAVAPLEKARTLEPHNRMIDLELADTYYALKRWEEAAESYLKFTRADAGEARAWKSLGMCYVALWREAAARLRKLAPGSEYVKALERDPEPDCAKEKLACPFAEGDYWRVAELAKAGNTPSSWYWRARAYEGLALRVFAQLSDLLPESEVRELLKEMRP
jgi:tetratricopeptide (TPR) repeat protein